MVKSAWLLLGFAALAIGMVGIAVPGLPTVPFLILATFAFARSDPRLETWLIEHPRFGTHLRAWRERGAIGPRAKGMALAMLAVSAATSFWLLAFPWLLLPVGACLAAGLFIATRPDR